ncbi:MAG: type II toxin-antitoxin system Phd/YefM family antitoxin [Marinobacter sp.]
MTNRDGLSSVGCSLLLAICYTAARTNLAKTMEQVGEDHSPVIITRSKSQSVVMISLEDFEALYSHHQKSGRSFFISQARKGAAEFSSSIWVNPNRSGLTG